MSLLSETKSIISEFEALHSQQTKQMKMELESQLSAERNHNKFNSNHIPPRFRDHTVNNVANGLPPPPHGPHSNGASTASFGTLFTGKAGSVFGTAAAEGTGPDALNTANGSPLPP